MTNMYTCTKKNWVDLGVVFFLIPCNLVTAVILLNTSHDDISLFQSVYWCNL